MNGQMETENTEIIQQSVNNDRTHNHNNDDDAQENQSTASALMKSTGFISNMTGFAIEYGSLLYFANFMTSFGIATLESLPLWLSGKMDMQNLFEGKNVGSLRS